MSDQIRPGKMETFQTLHTIILLHAVISSNTIIILFLSFPSSILYPLIPSVSFMCILYSLLSFLSYILYPLSPLFFSLSKILYLLFLYPLSYIVYVLNFKFNLYPVSLLSINPIHSIQSPNVVFVVLVVLESY